LTQRGLIVFAAACMSLVALAADASAASALVIEVPTPGEDSLGAKCVAASCPNLRSAVELADLDPGSTIVLAAGEHRLVKGEVSLRASTTIIGAGPTATRIVGTSRGSRVIGVEEAGAPVVTIEGLEVTGGELVGSPAGGGGVASLSSGTLTLRDVLVDHNQATGGTPGAVTGSTPGVQGGDGAGGGVYARGGLVLDHATVTANNAFGGDGGNAENGEGGFGGFAFGGSVDEDGGALTIVDSTIAGNLAVGGSGGEANEFGGSGGEANGAGIWDNSAPGVLIEASTIAANKANGGGGGAAHLLKSFGGAGAGARGAGMFLRDGIVENSTIAGNEGFSGAPGVGNTFGGEVVPPSGGGLYVRALLPLTFASDTFYANVASPATSGSGGNLSVNEGTSLTLRDTILAAGSAAPGSEDCAGSATDGGHNLEDRAPSQCGLSAANGDVLGASPLLAALAENGGPTETLALGPASPALGAGGACVDPANGGAPLAVDQRGLSRPAVCDIGAFQHQPPVNVAAPSTTGAAAVGRTLTCALGVWSGDAPLTYAVQWLRDGGAIAGASNATYAVATSDGGHELACQVTATNIYASASARSAPLTVPAGAAPPPVPAITGLGISHRVWREGSRLASLARRPKRAPVGTAIAFVLNTPARLTVAFTQVTTGRVTGPRGNCAPQTAHNRHRRRCQRTVTVGTLTFAGGHAGRNAITFLGRLSAKRRLPIGSYGLVLTAQNASGRASARGAGFTIVRR
jgi:hypothetical protein